MKDKIVEQVVNKYQERSKVGIEKYGTTLEGNTDGILVFLNHLQEELMDATLYIEKLKGQVKAVSELLNNPNKKEEWHNWDSAKKDDDQIKIDWSKVPKGYKYVAMNEDTTWRAFYFLPYTTRHYWESSDWSQVDLGKYSDIDYISSPPINWIDTLRERP